MNLLIAMPGPPEPDAAPPPELPSLTRTLARARRLPDAAEWRAGVHQALQGGEGASLAPAALAACALPQWPSARALCFVTPLHVVAGMTRVHLPPEGMLLLDERERAAWRDAFNAEFGDADLRLHAAGTGWLLTAACAHAASDAAPELLLGAALERRPAQGDAARALRRLGAEVEMWLAAHPLNDARAARQLPPVNSFWFWGGATLQTPAPFTHAPRVVSSNTAADPWLAGMVSHGAARLHTEVADLRAALQQHAGLIVLQRPAQLPPWEHWSRLEAQWFAPALQALRAGELESLRLQIGRSAWRLPDASPLRWLRRSRPWWQAVGT
jgi:hypothetical protein